ncbi:MAG: hypothetical protein H6732_14410 [Alphaproteobacteria bacterium]|nr:hypothetical protein [Alphaproteobacteria bacterium]
MRTLPWLALVACTTADPVDTDTDTDALASTASCLDDWTVQEADASLPCDGPQRCVDGACVDPWTVDAPAWSTCPEVPRAGGLSLAAKAAAYEDLVGRVHLHPDLRWVSGVRLRPDTDLATAGFDDVASWRSGENDGLWSSLYLASQAFRWAVTDGAERTEARARLAMLLQGERERMDVSGVPGNLVRQLVPPGVAGLACPDDLDDYRVDVEKDDNRWVRIDEEGCAVVLPATGDAWQRSGACPGVDHAGWCFLDNTSKDEYAGHVFALLAVVRLVDDAELQGLAAGLLADVGHLLADHALALIDHDGRVTEHGDLSPLTGRDAPGFNATMALAFTAAIADATDDARLDTLHACTVDPSGADCEGLVPPNLDPFLSYLPLNLIYVDPKGCLNNDNNLSMHLLSLVDLVWAAPDPALRVAMQEHLQALWDDPNGRALPHRHNAWYDMIFAAFKDLRPEGGGHAPEAVADAVCGLARFPVDKRGRDIAASTEAEVCLDRLDRPMQATPRPVDDRCPKAMWWWNDAFVMAGCTGDAARVEPPADYLLPYWMARYFGFVGQGD